MEREDVFVTQRGGAPQRQGHPMPSTMNDPTRKLVEIKQDYPSNYEALLSNFSTIITDPTKREVENLLPTGALSSTPYYHRTDKILAQIVLLPKKWATFMVTWDCLIFMEFSHDQKDLQQ